MKIKSSSAIGGNFEGSKGEQSIYPNKHSSSAALCAAITLFVTHYSLSFSFYLPFFFFLSLSYLLFENLNSPTRRFHASFVQCLFLYNDVHVFCNFKFSYMIFRNFDFLDFPYICLSALLTLTQCRVFLYY